MSTQLVLETPEGWMIRCAAHSKPGEEVHGWHVFPRKGRPNATWTFNGDLFKPTFTPSMNECVNPSNSPHFNPECAADRRCHFIVTAGRIQYCGDCTHDLKGQTLDMLPWSDAQVRLYAAIMQEHRATSLP